MPIGPLRVAIASRADESVGGASRAAATLARLLREAGHQVDYWVAYLAAAAGQDAFVLQGSAAVRRSSRLLYRASRLAGLPDILTAESLVLLRAVWRHRYDVIHFHDTVTAFSPCIIRAIARAAPTALTLHDCAAFTGGCIYPGACTHYWTRCRDCPQRRQWPVDSPLFDFTGAMQDIKRGIHSRGLVVTVAPCQWMADMAQKSGMFLHAPVVLRNGVDTQRLIPLERAALRRILGLPVECKIAVFSASYADDRRKGLQFVLEALRRLKSNRPLLLIVGHPPREPGQLDFDGIDHLMVGFVHDMRLLAQYYAAADIFLFPSSADNSPLVVLEAMAVGTPVVGFATGGVPESVVHESTGFLAAPGDVEGLAAGVALGLQGDVATQWGQRARRRAEEMFSYEVHLTAHLDLYGRMISGHYSARGGGCPRPCDVEPDSGSSCSPRGSPSSFL